MGGEDRSAEPAGKPPAAGALRLTDLLGGSGPVLALAHRLLADAWVVERLEDVAEDFRGIVEYSFGARPVRRLGGAAPGDGGRQPSGCSRAATNATG